MLIQSSPLDVALLGGVQTFRSVASPVVALRVQHPGNPWSFEAGAAIPEDVGGNFSRLEKTIGTTHYTARVRSFYEVHLSGNRELPHGEQRCVVPDAGFGVSMLHVSNQIDTATTYTWQYSGGTYTYQLFQTHQDNKFVFSPLFRVGVALFPDRLISFRSDVAYVGYANTATAAGQTFDLGFSGFMFRALLHVRL
jgi:hypothetical protein